VNDDIAICTVMAQTYMVTQFQSQGNGSVVDFSPMCKPTLSGVKTSGGLCNALYAALNLTQPNSTESNTPFVNEFCATANGVLTNTNYLLKHQQAFQVYLAPYDTDRYDCVSGGDTVSVPSPSTLGAPDSSVVNTGAYPVAVTGYGTSGLLNSGSIKTCKLVPKRNFLIEVCVLTIVPVVSIYIGLKIYRKMDDAGKCGKRDKEEPYAHVKGHGVEMKPHMEQQMSQKAADEPPPQEEMAAV
jgi:hypothetical protein